MHSSPPVATASLFLLSDTLKYYDELKTFSIKIAEGQDAVAVFDPSKQDPMSKFAVGDVEYTGDPLRDRVCIGSHFRQDYLSQPKAAEKRRERCCQTAYNVKKNKSLLVNDHSFLKSKMPMCRTSSSPRFA